MFSKLGQKELEFHNRGHKTKRIFKREPENERRA